MKQRFRLFAIFRKNPFPERKGNRTGYLIPHSTKHRYLLTYFQSNTGNNLPGMNSPSLQRTEDSFKPSKTIFNFLVSVSQISEPGASHYCKLQLSDTYRGLANTRFAPFIIADLIAFFNAPFCKFLISNLMQSYPENCSHLLSTRKRISFNRRFLLDMELSFFAEIKKSTSSIITFPFCSGSILELYSSSSRWNWIIIRHHIAIRKIQRVSINLIWF